MELGGISNKRYPTAIGLLLVLGMLWLQFSQAPLIQHALQRLEANLYDLRLKAMLPAASVDQRIVIVDIDEKSLRHEGHWPWPRDQVAQIVDRLFRHGAAVVGFDIVFAEAERNSGEAVLQRLTQAEGGDHPLVRQLQDYLPLFDNNSTLAASLRGQDVVLGYLAHARDGTAMGMLPQPLAVEGAETLARLGIPDIGSYTGNIALLQQAARFGGFFSLQPDADGIIRRAPLVVQHDGRLYPSLSLEVARLFMMAEQIGLQSTLVGGQEVLEAIRVGKSTIPTDSEGHVIIPYRGRWGSYPYLSATDVLQGEIPVGLLDNAIVLVGTTAQGLFDLRATPIQAVYPGVEAHANIISAILDNNFPMEPAWAVGADFMLTLLIGMSLALLFPRLAPLPLIVTSLGVFGAIIAFNFWIWSGARVVLELAPQLLLVLVLAMLNMAYGFLGEFRGKRQLQGMFGQYVPAALVQEMSENAGHYGFGGDSREMTVLFADIRGFTSLSETMSAGALKSMLNGFFTPMTRIIFNHRGTIDKYIGDMVMAFWGAPLDDREHAVHAVDAALEMLGEVERLKHEFKAAGLPEIEIGIGLNSGIMNVGDMGSEYRRAYTVLGDAVNLASRLEGITSYYQADLIVGEETYRMTGNTFACRELDLIRVKGKARAIRVFQPLCRRTEASAELLAELRQHDEALGRYRTQDWDGAEILFRQLQTSRPDVVLYALYLQRISRLRAAPPPADWDGVYNRSEK